MKHLYKILIALLFSAASADSCLAIPAIKILNDTARIRPFLSEENLNRADQIKVRFRFTDKISADTIITLTLKVFGENITGARIINPSFKITAKDWEASKDSSFIITRTCYIETHSINSLKEDHQLLVTLGEDDANALHIIFSKAGKETVNSTITIQSRSKNIAPFFNEANAPQIDSVKIRLLVSGPFDRSKNIASFYIDSGAAWPNDPQLQNTAIRIDEKIWNDAIKNNGIIDTVIFLETAHCDINVKTKKLRIKLRGDSIDCITVWLTRKNAVIPNKPFWIELGANFDVADGFKATNLYSGVFLYKKDLADKKGRTRLSILGGVYESKSSIGTVSSDSGLLYRDGRSYISDSTGTRFPVFRDTGILNATVTSTNVGLFFSPQYRLSHSPADSNGFHIFLSLWTEQLWQTIRTSYDYSKLSSPAAANTTLYVPKEDVFLYRSKTEKQVEDFRSHFFGLGMPMYLKEGEANLFVNPVFWGITNTPYLSKALDEKGNAIFSSGKKWHSFYLIQFRLSEEKFGFTFTGEIRGLYQKNYKPYISIALSKKIDLDNIGDYVQKILKF